MWSVNGVMLASKWDDDCLSNKSVVPESPTAMFGDVMVGITRDASFCLKI